MRVVKDEYPVDERGDGDGGEVRFYVGTTVHHAASHHEEWPNFNGLRLQAEGRTVDEIVEAYRAGLAKLYEAKS
jgi:hypothetical protein